MIASIAIRVRIDTRDEKKEGTKIERQRETILRRIVFAQIPVQCTISLHSTGVIQYNTLYLYLYTIPIPKLMPWPWPWPIVHYCISISLDYRL